MQRRTFLSRIGNKATAAGVIAGLINPFEIGRTVGSFYTGHDTEATAIPSGSLENGWRWRIGDTYRLQYRWLNEHHQPIEMCFSVDVSEYTAASNISRSYVSAFSAARSNPIAKRLSTTLVESQPTGTDSSLSSATLFKRAIAFVRSFQYATDPDTKRTPEYHRAVEETLIEGRGDCKDITYLLAGILSQPPFEYRTAMVFVPEHMLLGVRQADLPAEADYEPLPGTEYVPIETTSNYRVGTLSRGPLIGIYSRGFEYFDRRAASRTAVEFIRNPINSRVLTNTV